MSSAAGSWFQRILVHIPGLYKKQPCGNFHPFWHRLCFCREYEYCGDWRGGILDLKTGAVYVRQEVKQDDSGQDVLGKCPDCGFEGPIGKCPVCGGIAFRPVWELVHRPWVAGRGCLRKNSRSSSTARPIM